MDTQIVTSRIDVDEKAMLDKAVELSGRSMSDVIRRLIRLADTPQGRAILGIVVIDTGYAWISDDGSRSMPATAPDAHLDDVGE